MGLTERRDRKDFVRDLAEDLATRWVPDVLADVDIEEAVLRPGLSAEDVRLVDVPRADRGVRTVPVLSGSALGALRESVESLRSVSDDVLDPAVCGYRSGATGDVSYSEEYRRFRAHTEALGDDSSWVVVADVSNFFDSISSRTVDLALAGEFEDAEPVSNVLSEFRRLGVLGLPAGYGDARLIANAVLNPVDKSLGAPFTRWVDDYRIFTSTRSEADRIIGRMRTALGRLDLTLNESKLEITSATDYRRIRHGLPLDSVYHPQEEPEAAVRSALRSVFLAAASTGDRRRLRFSLPRLAQQRDSIAVDFAFHALHANSVDAPRLVHYLSAFTSDPTVASRIRALIEDHALSDWVIQRVIPLLYRVDLDDASLSAIARRIETTESSLQWGLLTRLLAIHRHSTAVDLINRRTNVQDRRAAIAAFVDAGFTPPDYLHSPGTEATIDALTQNARDDVSGVPLPRVDSLL